MMPWGSPGGVGLDLLWPLLWLLLVATVVIGAVYLFGSGSTASRDRTVELLREQYARGEISDEEFDERSSKLDVMTTSR